MFKTRNSLSVEVRKQVTDLLNQSLADLSDLYSQTKQAHWNVRGPSFYSLHKLFDEVAGVVEGHLDDVAERVTALGAMAQGTVRQAAAHSRLAEFPDEQNEEFSYLNALRDRYSVIGDETRKAIDKAAGVGDADSADLLTAVSRDLDKALWMLEAHSAK